jgi:hypothetical protein
MSGYEFRYNAAPQLSVVYACTGELCDSDSLEFDDAGITCGTCGTNWSPDDLSDGTTGELFADWSGDDEAVAGLPVRDWETGYHIEPPMTEKERAYYTAARDSQGGVRLNSGMGLLVADASNTHFDVGVWLRRAQADVAGRMERGEDDPFRWVRQYRAAYELMNLEAAA